MTRANAHPATTTAPTRVRTLRAAWAVAPRVIATRLGLPTPQAAAITLIIDLDDDTARVTAHLDGVEHTITADRDARATLITSEHAAHLSAPGIAELTALASGDTYEPVYIRAPFLDALDLEPASYDRPRLELD